QAMAATLPPAEPEGRGEFNEVGQAEADDEGHAFGSLLEMSNPFTGRSEEFVRIDEPVTDDLEPTVVFPEAAPAPQAAVDPDGAYDAKAPPQRQFDAPGTGPRTATGTQPQQPTDTDGALRSALATLQRMNGAT